VTPSSISLRALALALAGLAAASAAPAQFMTGRSESPADRPALAAKDIIERVGFDQRLGASLPLDASFRDEAGRPVKLGDYFGARPVVLALVYYRCPMLCTLVERGAAGAARALRQVPGRDYDFVFVSFDPQDTPERAAEKKRETVAAYGHPDAAAGFHFLTGAAPASAAVAEAVGFRWTTDPVTGEFAHAAGLVVATPDGRVSRYLYGAEFAPRDLKLALVESSQGKIGGPVEKMLLYCFRYDAGLGRYTAASLLALRVAAALTLAAIAGYFVFAAIRSRRGRGHAAAGGLA
jgi:protein SCO1/2